MLYICNYMIGPHQTGGCAIVQALDQRQHLALEALEEMVCEAERLPLLIPEALGLQGRLEAAQKLGQTVRLLLHLEEPDADEADVAPSARGPRRKSAQHKAPADDITLKVISLTPSSLHGS